MSNKKTIVITRKVTLYPQGDKDEINRAYNYIRNGQRIYSIMLNRYLSALYTFYLRHDTKSMPKAKLNAALKRLNQPYSRTPDSPKGSAYIDLGMSQYPKGLPIAGSIPRNGKQAFDKARKDGLLYGKVALPTFKMTTPMPVKSDFVDILGSKIKSSGNIVKSGMYHDYATTNDLLYALQYDDEPKLHIKFANKIVFDIVFGNPHKSAELRSIFEKIFNNEYKVCDSSIMIDKRTHKKIILNLVIKIPMEEHTLNPDIVAGVDVGLAIPAMCALNNDMYIRQPIGSYDDFTRIRTQMQAQRRRIQIALQTTKGGHGRNKKLKHLAKLQLHERDWVKTYNHMISKHVVDFALKNNAATIQMENLTGISRQDDASHKFMLRNWSYFELQNMIEYKAQKYGITVKYIKAADTSQICSVCGQKGEYDYTKDQKRFTCLNPACSCHNMYKPIFNADFNAARNIAMSTDYIQKKTDTDDSNNSDIPTPVIENTIAV